MLLLCSPLYCCNNGAISPTLPVGQLESNRHICGRFHLCVIMLSLRLSSSPAEGVYNNRELCCASVMYGIYYYIAL